MPWWKKKDRERRGSAGAALTELNEFMDPYHDRSMVADGTQAVVQPGKILGNLHERMERYAIDPLLDCAVEQFIDVTEAAAMVRLGLGPMLVTSTAQWAAELLYRELPVEWARHPIPPEFDLVEQSGGNLIMDASLQQIGRDVFNRATSRPPIAESGQEAELAELLPPDLASEEQFSEVFVTVLMLYLYKIAYASQAPNRPER